MIALWRALCLVGLGGVIETTLSLSGPGNGLPPNHLSSWAILCAGGAVGWSWATVLTWLFALRNNIIRMVTGKPVKPEATDPAVIAEELAALRAQLGQLRDTAHSYDLSFDDTLHRLDERLRRVEHKSEPTPVVVRRIG